jgi:hypothetical protein
MRRLSLLPAFLLLVNAAPALGQVKSTAPVPAIRIQAPASTPANAERPARPAKAGEPATAGAEAATENPRLQKIRQLSFDRRPSAILRAWAGPSKPPEKKPDGAEKKADDPVDLEMAALQRTVTLGQWSAVKAYLASLPEEEGQAGYKQILQSLRSTPMRGAMPGGAQLVPQAMEKNQFTADDVLALAAASPSPLDKNAVSGLGGILRQAIDGGTVVEHCVDRFKAEALLPMEVAAMTKRQAAQVLAAAGQSVALADFLPDLDTATKEKDAEALNLLARHFLDLHAKEKKVAHLEKAWTATQSVLAQGGVAGDDKDEAITRAVELVPKVKQEMGETWLGQSFTKEPQRGVDILATIGSRSAQGLQTNPFGPEQRVKELQLQKTAVDALLKASPDRATAWRESLTLLAGNWLREAEFTYQYARDTRMAPYIQRDRFGNVYYMNEEDFTGMRMPQQQQMPRPISTADVLECRPDSSWLKLVEEGLKPKLSVVFAQLFLKVNEAEKAFPYIEMLAKSHRDKAKALTDEFLRVWARNHDPNEANRHRSPYIFFYGFEQRAQSIPLTRSKQERNLEELGLWVRKLRALNVGELNEELLAKAFTTSHSTAEVYRLESVEKVFGSLDSIKPRTLAELAQQMRQNLAGVWRDPALQKDKKTNRKQKDIQAEVLRGYELCHAVLGRFLKKYPEEWSLHLARAAILHDENGYRQEVEKTSSFSKQREQALAGFKEAARLYAAKVKDLAEDEETTQVYEQWFYAGLGACDLQFIDEDKLPDLKQPALIRAAIVGLSGECSERHLSKFANALFTRMSAAKPAVKFRYLKGGFEIVGDHKQAYEARKVYDYYKDLVREIKLEAVIDGNDVVGHTKPFGVFVNLRHTREIERESGGFGRYLQNQNNANMFYYNYGRPLSDYRDRFQTAATEAVKEHFEVLSVTFQSENVNSRATKEYGWRYTPYAYILLKPRGPQVDKLPGLRLDLDFLDTSGYVVLPVESPPVPLDAKPEKADPRPYRKLQITQTLDERQADKGKLIVEIRASALGLVPDLDELMELKPQGFEVAKVDDQGVSVSKFDEASEENSVLAERTWMVTFQAKPGETPKTFHFGTPKVEVGEAVYQRYVDADLMAVQEEVDLEARYGRRSLAWVPWAIVGGVAGVGLLIGAVLLLRRPKKQAAGAFTLPEKLTPFTVLGLLRRIKANNGFSAEQREELEASIRRLEKYYFAEDGNGQVDLRQLAEGWVQKAS